MQVARVSGLGPLLAIVDEDDRFARWLGATLNAADYRSMIFSSYSELETKSDALGIKAVVLDLAAPELDRVGTIRSIRTASDVPILVVTQHNDETEKVAALDAGADDYLT